LVKTSERPFDACDSREKMPFGRRPASSAKRQNRIRSRKWATASGSCPRARRLCASSAKCRAAFSVIWAGSIRGRNSSGAVKTSVPDEQPAPGHAPLVEHEVAHLAVHLADGCLVDRHVVANVGEPPGDLAVAVLHVRHVDVDDAVEQRQRLEAVVAAGVVDERDSQPGCGGQQHAGQHLGHHMARSHEVDVVATRRLQLEHHPRQPAGVDLAAAGSLADLPVLAEDAAEAAPAEEDRARASSPAERWLLSVVRAVSLNDGPLARSADGAPNRLPAVHATPARTQVAVRQVGAGRLNAGGQLPAAQQPQVGRFERRVHGSLRSGHGRSVRLGWPTVASVR